MVNGSSSAREPATAYEFTSLNTPRWGHDYVTVATATASRVVSSPQCPVHTRLRDETTHVGMGTLMLAAPALYFQCRPPCTPPSPRIARLV